jgi:hypothetical protein
LSTAPYREDDICDRRVNFCIPITCVTGYHHLALPEPVLFKSS